MFAVIKAGGKQYKVAEDQVLKVEGVKGEPGTIVQLGDVIMLGGDTPQIGSKGLDCFRSFVVHRSRRVILPSSHATDVPWSGESRTLHTRASHTTRPRQETR